MLLIPCPLCGPRSETEFSYGGASRPLPSIAEPDASEWHRALHLRDNPRGPQKEFWYHASGCESWIEITRDTGTHTIQETSLPGISEGTE